MSKHVKNHPIDYPNLVESTFLIDRFHIKNHKADCFKHYNSNDIKILADINTQVCEQSYYLMNRFKNSTKHMTEASYYLHWLNYMNFKNTNKYNI